jgi:gluconate 5-dehydrogenase
MEISSLERAFGLADRRALITGGGSGLGFAIARCMISAGARVIITGRTADTLSRAAEELGNAAEWHVFDVTDTSHTGDFAETLLAKGPVDILVNNAGIHCKKPAEEISVEEFNAVLNVHLLGAFRLTQAFIPAMRKNRRGVILFISSMSGHIGLTKVAAYSAAKSGVLGLTHTLASELAADNIRVNAITSCKRCNSGCRWRRTHRVLRGKF